ncbi:hypothetical protein Tco_0604535 [Tanacetum coccineum]
MYLPLACYTLSKAEKTSFYECLHGVKVPSGYSAKVKNLVSMKDLKLVEGSIVQGYADEEVVQFYTNYMDDVADIGLPQPRHQGRLDKVGTIRRKDVTPTNDDFEQADFTVLQNMTYVIQLGYRPRRVLQYQGYDINGYTFYTKQQDDKSTVKNSGVTLIATMKDSSRMTIAKNSYYGVVEDIWELDYTSFVIPLLKCKWVNNTRAKQATQVFYIEDPKDKRWPIILQSKQSIVGVDDVVDEDEYNKFDELPPFSIGVEFTDDVLFDTLYLRSDHQEGYED